jgi:hypothetical protein
LKREGEKDLTPAELFAGGWCGAVVVGRGDLRLEQTQPHAHHDRL